MLDLAYGITAGSARPNLGPVLPGMWRKIHAFAYILIYILIYASRVDYKEEDIRIRRVQGQIALVRTDREK